MKARNAFTLIEMLVVIGIIAMLTGASIAAFSKMTRSAEKAKAQELVSNTATALSALYQREGAWPRRLLVANAGEHLLDRDAALPLASYMSLKTTTENGEKKLTGLDRFGILDIWGEAIIKNRGKHATESDVKAHILHFAIDVDEYGMVDLSNVDLGESNHKKFVRASAVVWGYDKQGKLIASWAKGQETDNE